MAFTPSRNLNAQSEVLLRDYQHAADTFNVDQFRLAPKHKFLFHVAFGINKAALSNIDLVQRYGHEINMLVKSIDLPNYTIQHDVLNQYNRKKVMQYQHKPNEIGVKFHDDNMGLINSLWQNYYSYYYADSRVATTTGSYERNATRNYDYITVPYGLDNGSSTPFFSYIKIYQMARKEYVCYELHNPIITSFNHNKLDYAQNAVHDVDMKLMYEAVSYSVGYVSDGGVEGFGIEHYDQTPSPLTGELDPNTISPSFNDTAGIQGSAASILDSVITQINTAQNTKQPGVLPIANATTAISASQVKLNTNIQPSLSNSAGTSVVQTLSGLQGFAFPFLK
jgi:hypothetical protein